MTSRLYNFETGRGSWIHARKVEDETICGHKTLASFAKVEIQIAVDEFDVVGERRVDCRGTLLVATKGSELKAMMLQVLDCRTFTRRNRAISQRMEASFCSLSLLAV